MRVALLGSVSSSWHALRGLIDGGVEVVGVLGLDPAVSAAVSDYRDLAPLANEHGLAYHAFHKVNDPPVRAFIEQQRPDVLFVIGLSQLVPNELLALPPAGGVGFHPTPLPEGRGRAPVVWTLLLDRAAAVNLFHLTEAADAGDLIAQVPVPVEPDDTAQVLIDRTNEILERTVRELGPAIRSGTLPRTPQDHDRASWYGRRGPEDGRIDWNQSAERIARLIRAAGRPYPGAFTSDRGARRIVWSARIDEDDRHVGTVGQVCEIDPQRGVLVQCGHGHLWLTACSDVDDRPIEPAAFRVGVRLGMRVEAEIEALTARIAALEAQQAAPGKEQT